ncbi:hypothetical protein T4D_16595 [Trichinella pseudospiralis]|uniref:Uncharacterized protein n=1 Tax=Trichinella pseudospiralis TaxID=6337 RepID=A0A0V1G1P1_TRIPS|nr:hypothetical protein T4D_16595 [Trichinella pseudospiralis]
MYINLEIFLFCITSNRCAKKQKTLIYTRKYLHFEINDDFVSSSGKSGVGVVSETENLKKHMDLNR